MWEKVAISDFRLIYLKMGLIGLPETSEVSMRDIPEQQISLRRGGSLKSGPLGG
jgi:hypothetical protein